MCLIVGLASWAAAPGVAGEQIVAGLSKDNVQITANFDGSSILIYGAIKRDAPDPRTPPLAVIVTVEGPATPVIVRKKEHVAGIWINGASVTVEFRAELLRGGDLGAAGHQPVEGRRRGAIR